MKSNMLRIVVLTFTVFIFFGLLGSSAAAYDEGKCKNAVKVLSKMLKPYKHIKIKTILIDIGEIDDVEGGMEGEAVEEHIEVPFEEISWCKRFYKYMNLMEEHCSK